MRPHRLQPTRLPSPWDSPGKNTGVGCHFLLQCIKVKVKSLSCVRLLATPWTAAHQAPPSMVFSRQEYWSGVPLPSQSACLVLLNCKRLIWWRVIFAEIGNIGEFTRFGCYQNNKFSFRCWGCFDVIQVEISRKHSDVLDWLSEETYRLEKGIMDYGYTVEPGGQEWMRVLRNCWSSKR